MTLDSLAATLPALSVPLPPPDPIGYPLPPLLLQGLSYLTLSLHLLAMSFTLGGLLLYLLSRARKGPGHEVLSRFYPVALPLGFSFLVTFGVPPLLFVQVLYGQMFYTSSVVIGAFWIAVIPLLITAYAALYAHKLTNDGRPILQWPMLLIAVSAMLTVGFIYVNNLTLSMEPGRWAALYHAHPAGDTLNSGEPTLLPRYLAFILPVLSVAGLALVILGSVRRAWGDEQSGKAIAAFGRNAHLVGRALALGAAAWLLSTLPQNVRETVIGGGLTTVVLYVAGGLVLVTTALTVAGSRQKSPLFPIAASVSMLLELFCLLIVRDHARLATLSPFFKLEDVPVNAQWGMTIAFALTLVLGLAFLVVITWKVGKTAAASARKNIRTA
ncbi:MAG: hypothetical protein MUC50_22480 [Myxococcota bacterium]|jgi:hypothetical protein|nr:hypothetical protein [Myxococcota bacterium]